MPIRKELEFRPRSYQLKNKLGTAIEVLNYGGIITSIILTDKQGLKTDVVLGFKRPEEYLENNHPYFGAIIGRYANRIANGKFTLDEQSYQLPINNGPNSLHGGKKGFDKVFWNLKEMPGEILLSYFSPDGEEGHPGNLSVTVKYTLSERNELTLEYEAFTDRPTHLNLTNHSYFNLSGGTENILGHELTLYADQYSEVDEFLIPTGKLINVNKGPFDFTTPKCIGERISETMTGYDHNYVLRDKQNELKLAATLYHPKSGRRMEVFTTEPGLQFYSGHFLDGRLKGKYGRTYDKYSGLCLETQHFPDSPNNPHFPSTILRPGEKFYSKTVYKFLV